MADTAHAKTDKKLEEIEKQLSAIYSRAKKEIQKTADEYFSRFAKQDEAKRKLLEQGKITEEEYTKWRKGDDSSTAVTLSIYGPAETTHSISSDFLPLATPTAAGAMKQAAAVANVTAAPTAEEFNALLKSLRDAGILATE